MRKVTWSVLVVSLVLGSVFWLLSRTEKPFPISQPEPMIEEQRHTKFGFIESVEPLDNGTQVYFTEAIWHTGNEAIRVAIESGVCTEETRDTCTPNDYFIESIDASAIPYILDADTKVVMMTYRDDINTALTPREISSTEFIALLQDEESIWHQLPYRITADGSQIKQIEEIYIP